MQIADDRPRRALISLTALIDVVFILLIFFMLASSFAQWRFLDLNVGESETVRAEQPEQSIVLVDFNNRYSLDGSEASLTDIVRKIKMRLQKNADHSVLVQPKGELPLQSLIVVLDAVGEIAGKNLSLAEDIK